MKEKLIRIWHNRIIKRILSFILVFVLVLSEPSFWNFAGERNRKSKNVVHAEEAIETDDGDETDARFKHLEGTNTVKIFPSQLADYSRACLKYHVYHQYDDLVLYAVSGEGESSTYFAQGFLGLGTASKPFGGSISIEAGNMIVLNLDHPLFNYVYDSVTLNNSGQAFAISREYDPDQTSQFSETNQDALPLLATNVLRDKDGRPSSTWNINVPRPSAIEEDNCFLGGFGGFIGRMWKDENGSASVTLNVTMNKTAEDQLTISVKGMSGIDVGLICGTMDENTSLTATLDSDRQVVSISSAYGHAGGLVGSMASGSSFTYTGTNIQNDGTDIKTTCDGKYAGGIVGSNLGTVTITLPEGTTQYPVKQHVEGKAGAGGVYGYYKPGADIEFEAGGYEINCQVNGTGYAGGLFGVLESEDNVTIKDEVTIISSHASGAADGYGGLIGRYDNSALSNKLLIQEITATPTRSSATYYGGAIGFVGTGLSEQAETVGGSAYVKFDGFTLASAGGANAMTFGGLIARADNAFIDANDVVIGVSGNNFKGGGLVGSLKSGVLRMMGTTNISGAAANIDGDVYKRGQIVGYRDCALVFAEKNWKLKRYASGVKADDIGAWGEVIRFDEIEATTEDDVLVSTEEKFGENAVVTIDEVNHVATVSALSLTDGSYVISSVADFAKVALHMQLYNSQSTGVLLFEGDSDCLSANIKLNANISLEGTGFTGFTRDNVATDSISATKCVYSGHFDGQNHTVTLAIGEPYGYIGDTQITTHSQDGFGEIYRHKYNGLFGITNTTGEGDTAKDVQLQGKVYVDARESLIYVGALAGRATGKFSINGVNLADTVTDGVHATLFQFEGGTSGSNSNAYKIYAGGLLGQAANNISSISVDTCSVKCNITSSNTADDSCYGGVIGWIAVTGQTASWTMKSVTVSGNISKTVAGQKNKLGGLIATISEYEGGTSGRTLALTDITVKGLSVSAVGASGNVDSFVGGLLGYSWLNVNPTFHNVVFDKDGSTGNSVSLSGTASNKGDLAGLVYNGSGYWKVEASDSKEGINIKDISVTAANARSFGMIVNDGIASKSAIYLEILADNGGKKSYAIDAAVTTNNQLSGLAAGCIFDEIVAYSCSAKTTDTSVLTNGQGVVSIHTEFATDSASSNSYQAQTSRGAVPNQKCRYYYNLDSVRAGSSNADLLMRWALNIYAHKSLRSYFELGDGFAIERDSQDEVISATIPDKTYDLEDYSWYPVDMSGTATINGTFKFYNEEFEDGEAANSSTYSYARTSLYDSTNSKMTQHHLLHCGLFRNVAGGVTIGASGIALQGNIGIAHNESGALICGTLKGASTTSIASFTTNGNISLSGIYVHDHNSNTYAPLLINKIGEFSTVGIKNVKAESGKYANDFKAASSLIGDVGSATATNINISFSDIQIDAREETIKGQYNLNDKYNTNSSLFYRATLLNTFRYTSGSGTYEFNINDDWIDDNGSYVRTGASGVTYGEEIGDADSQHLGKEYWYKDTNGGIYVNYNAPGASGTGAPDPAISFGDFLPYVYDKCTKNQIESASDKKYQLKVNWADTQMSGCGTYNDPYILTKASDFQDIANILNGTHNASVTVTLPCLNSGNSTFNATQLKQKKWDDYGDAVFTYDSNAKKYLISGTSNGYAQADVQNYLAGAYYKIDKDITLASGFTGFCNINNEAATFRGVIVGNGETITLTGDSPLIYQSNGCVVKGINIKVEKSLIELDENGSNTAAFSYGTSGCKAYGAVIGKVLGGDNIIDNVTVSYGNSKIRVKGSLAQTVPVGGYVGVVVKGTLVFRGMEKYRETSEKWDSIKGLKSNTVIDKDNNANLLYTDVANKTPNMKWLYVNPIVGRVINAAVFTEGEAYRPFEDGTREGVDAEDTTYEKYSQPVTMQNGTKNYSIADITKNLDMFTTDVPERTSAWPGNADFRKFLRVNIGIPNAQALYVMSLVTQAGLGATNYLERKDRGTGSGSGAATNNNYYPDNYVKPVGGYQNTGDWGIAPYYKYRSTHSAEYTYVGNRSLIPSGEPSAVESGDSSDVQGLKLDYQMAKTDNAQFNRSGTTTNHRREHCVDSIPYIISAYTPKIPKVTEDRAANAYDSNYFKNIKNKELGYIAFCITHQYTYLNLTFSAEDENYVYYMPDGFRGLGCIGYNNFIGGSGNSWTETYQDMIVHLYGIEGNGHTVNLNMSLNSYYQVNGKYDYYAVASDSPGFGFIDAMMQNKTCAVGKAVGGVYNNINVNDPTYQIRDFTITGSVQSNVYNASTGSKYQYTSGLNNNRYCAVGGLIGNVVYRTNEDIFKVVVSDVELSNLKVEGVRNTGGILGYNQSDNSINSETVIRNIVISDLEVSSGIYAGGLIGYTTQTAVNISNITIAEPNIHLKLEFNRDAYTDNAVGGIIGYASTGSNNGAVYLHGITLGTASPSGSYEAYIGYNPEISTTTAANETVRVGGLIGQIATNSSSNISTLEYNTKIEKCCIYNVNLKGHKAGGIIGASESDTCYVGVFDTLVKSSSPGNYYIMGQQVSSNGSGGSGGIIGYTDSLKNRLTIQNCNVQGYILNSSQNAGGLIGRASGSDTYRIVICDSAVNGIRLHSTTHTGGMIGYLNKSLDGYNLLTNNLMFMSVSGAALSNYGNLVGSNNSKTIRIAGFSRQGLSDTGLPTGYSRRAQMVGNKTNTQTPYGSNGYVIFADYEGTCTSETSRSLVASDINDDNNIPTNDYFVETMTNDSVGNLYPYVTTSPKKIIGTSSAGQFLTGDAVGKFGAGTFTKIISERTAVQGYENLDNTSVGQSSVITSKMTTAFAEFSATAYPRTNENFPLLIVEDNNYQTVTQMINAYINVLANTQGVNYAEDNAIHRISLNKCTYDSENLNFHVDETPNSACLRRVQIGGNYCFRMTGARVDNENLSVAQFSLLDVQFLNPNNTDEVAYHLYIPVYVRKVLQFEFSAGILSNTEYYPEAYDGIKGNVVFENLGNPVTIKFQYKYDRTAAEWAEAINGGENVLGNINKELSLTNHTGQWPTGTKMVLVDASNQDRFYYLDTTPNGTTIDLRSFADGAGNSFEVAPLINLMTGVVVSQSNNGTLMETTADDPKAIVKAGDTYYRAIEETDTGLTNEQKFSVTSIGSVNSEEYYLTIFTPSSESDTNIYHYEIKSLDRLEKTGENDTGWRPNEVKVVNGKKKNDNVGLFTGKLYEISNFTMSVLPDTREMNADQKYLGVTMTSTISLCGSAQQKIDVANNMRNNRNSSSIYQTFLVTYDMKETETGNSQIGIQTAVLPNVVFFNYDFYEGSDKTGERTDILSGSGDHVTENYVELRNAKNFISELSDSSNGYAVTMDLGFRLVYDDVDNMFYQFPPNANGVTEIGSRVIGYANVASSDATAAYSATSEKCDTETTRYYTAPSEKAKLTYNVIKTQGEIAGPYSDLGINAADMEENTWTIHTQAQYDISKLKVKGEYVELTIQLSCKSDYSSVVSSISEYIDGLKIYGAGDAVLFNQDEFVSQAPISTYDTNGKLVTRAVMGDDYFTLRVAKSALKTLGDASDGRYVIPITFDVFTGDDKFNNETGGFTYSNYRVVLSAKMFETAFAPANSYLVPSAKMDYIVYTNAKVNPDVIVP